MKKRDLIIRQTRNAWALHWSVDAESAFWPQWIKMSCPISALRGRIDGLCVIQSVLVTFGGVVLHFAFSKPATRMGTIHSLPLNGLVCWPSTGNCFFFLFFFFPRCHFSSHISDDVTNSSLAPLPPPPPHHPQKKLYVFLSLLKVLNFLFLYGFLSLPIFLYVPLLLLSVYSPESPACCVGVLVAVRLAGAHSFDVPTVELTFCPRRGRAQCGLYHADQF